MLARIKNKMKISKYIFKNIWLLFVVTLPSNGQEFIEKIDDIHRPINAWYATYGIGLLNLLYVGLKNQIGEKTTLGLTYGYISGMNIVDFSLHSLTTDFNYYISPKNFNSLFFSGSLSLSNFASNTYDGNYLVYVVSPTVGYEHISESTKYYYFVRVGFLIGISYKYSPLKMYCGSIGMGFQLGK
ncbi:MAG: hypothetical protein Q8L88_00975 [Bacteroidota bacterium]|nr:hypothetical protein [Bacteroidota bacterium]